MKLWFLGPPRVEFDGHSVKFGTRKATALLAYLSISERPKTRDTITSLLWPAYEQEKANGALRTTIWAIRKQVGDQYLLISREQIGIKSSSKIWVDVWEFLNTFAQGLNPEQNQSEIINNLEKAISLYNGDFLDGFTLRDSLDFDDWQLLQSENLRRKFALALKALSQVYAIQHKFSSAIAHTHLLISLDPLDEESHRQLMELYAKNGQRTGALRQFDECQQMLEDELGIAPSKETLKLYDAIKTETLATTSTSSQIPHKHPPTTDTGLLLHSDLKARFYEHAEMVLEKPRILVGRDELSENIHKILDSGEVVFLHGMGGIGKTSLAATVAAERIKTTGKPVIWLEAGNAEVDTLFEALARAFDQQHAFVGKTGDDLVMAVRKLLLEKNALLVLDNIWNTRSIYHFMKGVPPGMAILATSRQAIPIDGELLAVPQLDSGNAVMLLNYHARQEFDDESAANSLCEMLGNHPFALEIAGKQLKLNTHLTPKTMMESIADAPHDLSIPGSFAELGREAVKDLLDSSIDGLGTDSLEIFVCMGGMFSPFATTELLSLVTGYNPQAIDSILVTLQQHGLAWLIPAVTDKPKHYRIHDLTYSYSRALFKQRGRNSLKVIEAIQHFVTEHAKDFDKLEFEQANILGAVQAAHRTKEYGVSIGILSELAIDGYLDARGYAPLMLECIDAAIEVGRQMEPDHHENLHFLVTKRGNAFANSGAFNKALKAYEMALELSPNLHRKSTILCVIGGVRFRQGEDDYNDYLEEAYHIAKAEKDDVALGRVLEYRGNCAASKGEYKAAHGLFAQAVEVAERAGDLRRLVSSLYNLAISKTDLGQHQQALIIHQRIHQLGQDNSNHEWVAMASSGMARSYHNMGQRSEAQRHLERALTLYHKVGDTNGANWVVNFAGQEEYPIAIES